MENKNFELAVDVVNRLSSNLERVIKGKSETIKLIIAALIADGHVLLEDYPGSGKTVLTKTLGKLINAGPNSPSKHILSFRRIQFTPDMLPGDVLGVNVFDPKSASFHFVHGPVFAHIVLADEINRTGPKVQAAFLECMAEKQVTIDNVTYPLDDLFFVVGTQNPLDIAGTYPLPLVQLDRFMMKLPMSYVDSNTEYEILAQHSLIQETAENLSPVCERDEILAARTAVENVHLSPDLRGAIVNIVQATRNNPVLEFGASTRASIMLQSAMKGWAIVNNRNYATEDDLKFIAPFVLLHRLKFHAGSGNPLNSLEDIMLPHLEGLVRESFLGKKQAS